jgi:hypothetical protein
MSGQIFISYRRDESRWSARSLCDRLAARFDRNQIFMDIDTIGLGEDFVKTIEETVGACDVLIAVIGAHWLTSTDGQGGRRLDNPEDFVRMEIATALRRNIRVIPVLVDGALMPQSTDLPDDLKPLVRRNALQVGDTHFDDDCRRLVATIEQVLAKNTAARREREEKERLEHEPQSPFAPSRLPAKPEVDKLSAEAPKVVSPLAPEPAEPKPVEPKPEMPPPPSSGGTGRKSLSKKVIAFLAIAAVLVVGVYLATRLLQWRPPQHGSVAAVTPSPPVIAPPLTPQPTTPTSTPSAAESLDQAQRYLDMKDFANALPLLQKAADGGNTSAMNKLGDLYYDGRGVAQDYGKAREWYQKAVDAGNTDAMYNLGVLYEYGRGVAQDYGKAREWYQKAADAGNTDAKQALASQSPPPQPAPVAVAIPSPSPAFEGTWELVSSTENGVTQKIAPTRVTITQSGRSVRIGNQELHLMDAGTVTYQAFYAHDAQYGHSVGTEDQADLIDTFTWRVEGSNLVFETTFDYKAPYGGHPVGKVIRIMKYRRVAPQ